METILNTTQIWLQDAKFEILEVFPYSHVVTLPILRVEDYKNNPSILSDFIENLKKDLRFLGAFDDIEDDDDNIVVKLKVENLANNETIIYVSFYDGNFTVGLHYEKW